jgi:hypothetical protein
MGETSPFDMRSLFGPLRLVFALLVAGLDKALQINVKG